MTTGPLLKYLFVYSRLIGGETQIVAENSTNLWNWWKNCWNQCSYLVSSEILGYLPQNFEKVLNKSFSVSKAKQATSCNAVFFAVLFTPKLYQVIRFCIEARLNCLFQVLPGNVAKNFLKEVTNPRVLEFSPNFRCKQIARKQFVVTRSDEIYEIDEEFGENSVQTLLTRNFYGNYSNSLEKREPSSFLLPPESWRLNQICGNVF